MTGLPRSGDGSRPMRARLDAGGDADGPRSSTCTCSTGVRPLRRLPGHLIQRQQLHGCDHLQPRRFLALSGNRSAATAVTELTIRPTPLPALLPRTRIASGSAPDRLGVGQDPWLSSARERSPGSSRFANAQCARAQLPVFTPWLLLQRSRTPGDTESRNAPHRGESGRPTHARSAGRDSAQRSPRSRVRERFRQDCLRTTLPRPNFQCSR